MTAIADALNASSLTWVATAVGAGLVFMLPRLPRRAFAGLTMVAAMVMLWASVFALLLPAGQILAERWGTTHAAALTLGMAAVGAVATLGLRRLVQGDGHAVPAGDLHGPRIGRNLFAVMTIHHVPEGMAVGLAMASAATGAPGAGFGAGLLVLAMAGHNIVEGALVSLPMHAEGATRRQAFVAGQVSGLAEVVGAVIGAAAVGFATALLPWGLALAGGAMLAVTVADLVPATWRNLRPVAGRTGVTARLSSA